jgi:GH15 family glucan-1,4-alpha-glucosidase
MALVPRLLIEDHALIGDLHTAALVAKNGSIDFMCLPDFDSDACFASLLGTPDNGQWRIAPVAAIRDVHRRYRGDTLILETDLFTDDGAIRLVDFMPLRHGAPRLVRSVCGLEGEVRVDHELRPRFAHGYTVPVVAPCDGIHAAVAGPDALYLRGGSAKTPPPFETTFTVRAGERVSFELSWARPYDPVPAPIDTDAALRATEAYWRSWVAQLRVPAEHRDLVVRSLVTLKACTFEANGAIVAAPTYGLPETPGGVRNWDYRYCWIRDSALALNALMATGRVEEASRFGKWLTDAVGGAPAQVQIMYGIRGERRLTETTLDWLAGYEGSRPVRIGNAAYAQRQLDVLGELAASVYTYVQALGHLPRRTQRALLTLVRLVGEGWRHPDHGIWESRGAEQHFTASKVAAWAAVDGWLRVVAEHHLELDPTPWVALRGEIFDDVCRHGFDAERNTFTQYYGSKGVDASLLFIPMSGFLPADDPRVAGTVAAIERELIQDGLVLRYRTDDGEDGLHGEEGTFLACSFWLANTYAMMGRHDDARRLFERVAGLANDVGLLAEEYSPKLRRQLGNFPQAFSHLALVSSAFRLFGRQADATTQLLYGPPPPRPPERDAPRG